MHRLDAIHVAALSRGEVVRPPFVVVRAAGILIGVGTAGGEGRSNADRDEVGNGIDVIFVCGARDTRLP
jgi:hypothetical protein